MVPPSRPSPEGAAHYFSPSPDTPSRPGSVELVLPDVRFDLATDRGVFAADRVDPGTKLLLLDGPAPTPGDQVLADVGCGYGPIACTLAGRNPQATVWAVDVNGRARDLCRANAERAGLGNVTVADPASVPGDLVVDRIWSNPPIRVGKAELHDLLRTWLARLAPNGSAHLVVQKHLGADSLHRWLEAQGWAVSRRASRKAYRLLDVTRPATAGAES
ncbi:MAG: methyltransferase [Acidimicrobiales bacterium]